MTPHPHANGAVSPCLPLIHDRTCEQSVKFKQVLMPHFLQARVLFHIAQTGKVVGDLTLESWRSRCGLPSFFQGTDFFQSERIAFDRGGGVTIASAGVFLKRRNPRNADGRTLDAFPQPGDSFHQGKQRGRDCELGLVGHGLRQP